MECDFQKNYLSSTTVTNAYLTTKKAADYLCLQPQTLRKWRLEGKGPRYIRLGDNRAARTVYRLADLEAWLEAREFSSTSEETVLAGEAGGE